MPRTELWLTTDGAWVDVHLQVGRRKMKWDFQAGDQDILEFKDALLDILSQLGEEDPIREYQDSIRKGIEAGHPVIDPRNPVQGVMDTPAYKQATRGAQWFSDDADDSDLGTAGIIDYDNPQARSGADRAAQSGGVTSSGKGAEGVDYGGRFAPKDTDKRR